MKRTFTLVLSLACIYVPLLELSTQAINSLVISQTTSTNKNKSNEEISSLAKKITVQIFQISSQREEKLIGTGFIVKKQTQEGNNSKYDYQILTNDHVVKKLQNGYQYQVKTYDERIYKAFLFKNANKFNNYDLAILTFTSSAGYQTAKLGNSSRLEPEQQVFVVGFPCKIPCKPKLTIKSGVIAPIEFLLGEKTLAEGYRIGYDIDVEPGTSGGPIIDTVGEVVGVNGRSKSVRSPFANAPDPYTFTDNTQPDKNIKLLMRYFAWGIPIETYTHLNNNTNLQRESTPQPNLSVTTQSNDYRNSQSPSIASNNSLIGIIILVNIGALIIIIPIAWFLLNEWYKYKNEPRFQAIENNQKKLESNLSLTKDENQQTIQAIKINQEQQEYNFSSQKDEIKKELKAIINDVLSSPNQEINSQLKFTEIEQKLSIMQVQIQQLESLKALIEQKEDQGEKLQNTSSTEE